MDFEESQMEGQKLPAGDYPAELAAELEGSDLLLCAAVLCC